MSQRAQARLDQKLALLKEQGLPTTTKVQGSLLFSSKEKKILRQKGLLPAAKAQPKKVEKQSKTEVQKKKFGKKGQERVIKAKLVAGESFEAVKRSKQVSGPKAKVALKQSIKPGSVLILLAGKFAGSRVVFLKQLESGSLLVTGPYKLNGVPLRRVDQTYVIATSTSVDISGVKVPENVNDAFFAVADKKNKSENKEVERLEASEDRKKVQEAVDSAIIAAAKVEFLTDYLKSKFQVSRDDKPHEMKF